jgi:antitoxin HicB
MSTTKTLDDRIAEIKARPYQRELVPEEGGGWFARIAEFPGCMTEGDTPAEALENLDDAMDSWLHVILEDGDAVPDPLIEQKYSGKTVVRLGTSLHRDAAIAAERDGVSLNQYITLAVARCVGSAVGVGVPAQGVMQDSSAEHEGKRNCGVIAAGSSDRKLYRFLTRRTH